MASGNVQLGGVYRKLPIVWSSFSLLIHIRVQFITLYICYRIVQPKIDYTITIRGYTFQNYVHMFYCYTQRDARIIANNYDFVTVRPTYVVKKKLKSVYIVQLRDYSMTHAVF